jgi:uncharacterized SAM-binding protein YcdF (DUF218 family)
MRDGAVAQLGERLVRNEEVRGSIPLSSTTVPRITARLLDLEAPSRRAMSADLPSPVAVVIFGAAVRPDGRASTTLRRRVDAALRFGAAHGGTFYVPTGAVGRYGKSEASVMADLLREGGVPNARILPEESGTDTLSSVRAVAALLRGIGHAGPVYAATSAYHLPRCVALMRLAGLPARACPPPPVPARGGGAALGHRPHAAGPRARPPLTRPCAPAPGRRGA